jgi:hypothetical protein
MLAGLAVMTVVWGWRRRRSPGTFIGAVTTVGADASCVFTVSGPRRDAAERVIVGAIAAHVFQRRS